MTCGHCGSWNDEDDHRCHRCGRRLHLANARAAKDVYPMQGATAPALFQVPNSPSAGVESPVEEPPANARRRQPVQPSLFSHRETPQVVSIASERQEKKRSAANQGSKNAPKPVMASSQQSFELVSMNQPRVGRSSPEAVIYCDAPVASKSQRILASAIDLSFVAIAIGILLLTYHLAGGTFPENKYTIRIFLAMGAMVYLLYEALWSVACGDTPGMRGAHLRVIHFDGRRPELRERIIRFGASLLSIAAGGIGLIWALADEESLTWHDHMSNTFPTNAEPSGD